MRTERDADPQLRAHRIRFGNRSVGLPRSLLLRRAIGGGLVVGGLLGFLPVLGFWMVPLGLAVLSVDSPLARRLRRRGEVGLLRRWRAWKARRKGGH